MKCIWCEGVQVFTQNYLLKFPSHSCYKPSKTFQWKQSVFKSMVLTSPWYLVKVLLFSCGIKINYKWWLQICFKLGGKLLTRRAVGFISYISLCWEEVCVENVCWSQCKKFSLRRIEKSQGLLFLSYPSCSLTLKLEKVKHKEVNWRIFCILLGIWDIFGKVRSQ